MDVSFALPLAASVAAVVASLVKNIRAKKTAQSMFMITRPDGSKIKLETDIGNEDELKRLVEQIVNSEPTKTER